MYTQPQRPGGGPARALLYGAITFALVFLLIVGLVVAYLVVRSVTAGGDPTAGPTTSATTTSAAPTTTSAAPVEEEWCWYPPDAARTSSNPSGKLRGGGLQFTPPSTFPDRRHSPNLPFAEDTAMAVAPVESTWVSTISVGAVHWQDGVEYPGDEAAANRLTDCFLADSSNWGDTTGRTEANRTDTAVEIDGMAGHQVTVDYQFAEGPTPSITGYSITVVVVSTPEGPSYFLSEVPVGHEEHTAAAAEALAGLTGV